MQSIRGSAFENSILREVFPESNRNWAGTSCGQRGRPTGQVQAGFGVRRPWNSQRWSAPEVDIDACLICSSLLNSHLD